jgi:hypothetical protein
MPHSQLKYFTRIDTCTYPYTHSWRTRTPPPHAYPLLTACLWPRFPLLRSLPMPEGERETNNLGGAYVAMRRAESTQRWAALISKLGV